MDPTPCCNTTQTCAKWGSEWSVCRDPAFANCSKTGEQCAGTGGSAMDPKACCTPGEVCHKLNQYYSVCQAPPSRSDEGDDEGGDEGGDEQDDEVVISSCPGLSRCPQDEETKRVGFKVQQA